MYFIEVPIDFYDISMLGVGVSHPGALQHLRSHRFKNFGKFVSVGSKGEALQDDKITVSLHRSHSGFDGGVRSGLDVLVDVQRMIMPAVPEHKEPGTSHILVGFLQVFLELRDGSSVFEVYLHKEISDGEKRTHRFRIIVPKFIDIIQMTGVAFEVCHGGGALHDHYTR